jgi:hypothetical protein
MAAFKCLRSLARRTNCFVCAVCAVLIYLAQQPQCAAHVTHRHLSEMHFYVLSQRDECGVKRDLSRHKSVHLNSKSGASERCDNLSHDLVIRLRFCFHGARLDFISPT